MMTANILKIGIASREEQRARTRAIARGEFKPSIDDPKVWFTSIESFAPVLSTKNKLLLEIIQKSKPASLSELAKLSEREESNLSRTLHTMARYGFVVLEKTDKGRLVAMAPYDAFHVEYNCFRAAA
jgi:predicted transcriptional regulator